MILPSLDQPFVEDSVQTKMGDVPSVSYTLAQTDHWGNIKARRMWLRSSCNNTALGREALSCCCVIEPDNRAGSVVSEAYEKIWS